jgi:hypothetical protein
MRWWDQSGELGQELLGRHVDEAALARQVEPDATIGQQMQGIDGEPLHGSSGRNDYGFGVTIADVPTRGTVVVVASNAAANYNVTALTVQLTQMTLGALLELP